MGKISVDRSHFSETLRINLSVRTRDGDSAIKVPDRHYEFAEKPLYGAWVKSSHFVRGESPILDWGEYGGRPEVRVFLSFTRGFVSPA